MLRNARIGSQDGERATHPEGSGKLEYVGR
jgi:hypothetical protein